MNIKKYIAFLRSAELGSITTAAEELGYTQSAVSKMISDLETEWGVSLFTRSHSGTELTSEGENLLPKVREIVRGYDDLNFAVSEMHGLRSGILRLGCFTSFSTSYLPEILKNFKDRFPDINIELQIGEYEEIAGWLSAGKIDCGILDMKYNADADMTMLLRDSLVAILPEDHPLASEKIFKLRSVEHERFIFLRELLDFEMDSFFSKNNVQPGNRYEVNSDFTLLSMVENGLGMSIVHKSILYPPRFRVVMVPLDKTMRFDIGIGVRKGSQPSEITKLFIGYIKERMGENIQD